MTNYLEKFLMRDISKLYQNADDYNVIIYVGEEHNVSIFKAHSVILRARSSYFHAALSSKWAKKDDHGECYILRKPNISPEVFQILLSYIYTGGIPLEDDTIKSNYLNLMIAADELALGELIDHIQDHIVAHEVNWIRDNLVQIIQISSKHEACHKLQLICQEILDNDPSAIFQARDFVMLEEQALIDMLKRDDLEGKEITIWEHVIRWGLAQKPLGSEDLSEWTEEDFTVLQHTLKNCIPHIRFFHISGSDYWDKITPYKKLLSKQLKHELKTYYITGRLPTKNVIPPQRMGAITNNKSVLICWKHFCQIASWIDEKTTRYKPHEIPYTFDLLLRGSRDGLNDLNEFHQKCDNVGPTIVVIQVADLSGKIVGGYNPISWKSESGWGETNSSFIFSMENGKTLDNCMISRVTSPERAIWNAPRNPCFSHDLQWFKGKFKQSSYEKKIYDSEEFTMIDIEIYRIVKKNEIDIDMEIDNVNNGLQLYKDDGNDS
ncbi:hypothetical protein C2G38_2245168 [Gigaspora rosea]|uniref:BTB/POZ domain-containing protein n=1 Tax=Gigaspora rosea TaxID=44941 RepID=A0A397VJR3_9GLOM|nr:hypothetical protein C2G38_2245168 [Gigaspora rosea]